MSIFDNELVMQRLKHQIANKTGYSMFNLRWEAHPGDILIYSKFKKMYLIAKHWTEEDEACGEYIVIGVILQLYKDYSVNVMLKNYLTEDSIHISSEYLFNLEHICAYIYKLFLRYVKTFNNLCPAIKKIKKLLPKIIDLSALYVILDEPRVHDGLKSIVGDEAAEIFFNKLYNNHIYVNDAGHLKIWTMKNKQTPEIIECSIIGGMFLATCHIKLLKKAD